MNTENKDELFNIRLNNEGISHLLRYAKLIKIYLVSGLTWSLISLIADMIIVFDGRSIKSDSLIDFYYSAHPFIYIVVAVIYLIQLYIYNKLRICIKNAINNIDENLLSISFSYLVKAVIVTTILNVISVFLGGINLFITIKAQY